LGDHGGAANGAGGTFLSGSCRYRRVDIFAVFNAESPKFAEIASVAVRKCELCPRRCGVDRSAGERGYCRAGANVEVYRYGPHRGEEPPISGTRGSGTVFFGRCTLRCLYCQNYPWSQEGAARECSVGDLAGMFWELWKQGCHNWNLVSPTPWLRHIRIALRMANEAGAFLPVVYNTSGFERPETLAEEADFVDVFLTDLRYAREESARTGSGFAGYVAAARESFLAMWRLAGPLRLDEHGLAVKGTICRLLILPGRAEEAIENLQWLAETVGTEVAVSVMAQYVPAYRAAQVGSPWDRGITVEEYDAVCRTVEELGFVHGWVQEQGIAVPDDLLGFKMGPSRPDSRKAATLVAENGCEKHRGVKT